MEFNQLVDAAIEQNRKQRALLAEHAKHCHPVQFAKDSCTVRVDVGRATGKTNYIIERARPWDAVVMCSRLMVNHYQHQVRARGLVTGGHVFTAGEFGGIHGIHGMPRSLLGRRWVPRTIYVDEASRIDPERMHAIYFALASHPDQTFVLLG